MEKAEGTPTFHIPCLLLLSFAFHICFVWDATDMSLSILCSYLSFALFCTFLNGC